MNYTFSMGNNFFYLQCCPRVVMSCYLLRTPRCGGCDDVRMESQLMMIEWCHWICLRCRRRIFDDRYVQILFQSDTFFSIFQLLSTYCARVVRTLITHASAAVLFFLTKCFPFALDDTSSSISSNFALGFLKFWLTQKLFGFLPLWTFCCIDGSLMCTEGHG